MVEPELESDMTVFCHVHPYDKKMYLHEYINGEYQLYYHAHSSSE